AGLVAAFLGHPAGVLGVPGGQQRQPAVLLGVACLGGQRVDHGGRLGPQVQHQPRADLVAELPEVVQEPPEPARPGLQVPSPPAARGPPRASPSSPGPRPPPPRAGAAASPATSESLAPSQGRCGPASSGAPPPPAAGRPTGRSRGSTASSAPLAPSSASQRRATSSLGGLSPFSILLR